MKYFEPTNSIRIITINECHSRFCKIDNNAFAEGLKYGLKKRSNFLRNNIAVSVTQFIFLNYEFELDYIQ